MQFSEYKRDRKPETYGRRNAKWDDSESTAQQLFESGGPIQGATKTNSLRMRNGKPLSSKIGANYTVENGRAIYMATRQDKAKILALMKPKKPTNPLGGEMRRGVTESPTNSLRLRRTRGKGLSKKISEGFDRADGYRSYVDARKTANKIRSRVKPKKPTNPLGDNTKFESDTRKVHLKQRNRRFTDKVGVGFDINVARVSYLESKKEGDRIRARSKPSGRGSNPLSEVQ